LRIATCILLHARQQLAIPVPLAFAWPRLAFTLVREVAKIATGAVLAAHISVHEQARLALTEVVAGRSQGCDTNLS
jgi:hypothetical protein